MNQSPDIYILGGDFPINASGGLHELRPHDLLKALYQALETRQQPNMRWRITTSELSNLLTTAAC